MKIGKIMLLALALILITVATASAVTVTVKPSDIYGTNTTFMLGENVIINASDTSPYNITFEVYAPGPTLVWSETVNVTNATGYPGYYNCSVSWKPKASGLYGIVYIVNGGNPTLKQTVTVTGGITSLTIDGVPMPGIIKANDKAIVYLNLSFAYKPNRVVLNMTNFGLGNVTMTLVASNETQHWYNYTTTLDLSKATYAPESFDVVIDDYYVFSYLLEVRPNNATKWIVVEADTNKPNKSPWNTTDSDDTAVLQFGANVINATIYIAVADKYGNVLDSQDIGSDVYNATVYKISGPTVNINLTNVRIDSNNPYQAVTVSVMATDAPCNVTIGVANGVNTTLEATTKTIYYSTGIAYLDVVVEKPMLYANNSDSTRVYVYLKDANGNTLKLSGYSISLSEETALGLGGLGTNKTDAGVATFTVTAGTKSGVATIVAVTADGSAYGKANITLKPAPNITYTAAGINVPATIKAGEPCKIEFTLKDYANEPIKNCDEFPVEFNITSGDAVWLENNETVYVAETTDANGNVSATLYSTNASTTIVFTISVKNETGGWVTLGTYTVNVTPNVVADVRVLPGEAIGLPAKPGSYVNITLELVDAYGNINASDATVIVTTDNPSLGNMSNATATVNNNLIVNITNGVGNFTYTVNTSEEDTATLTLNVTDFGIIKTITITTSGPKGVKVYFNKTLPLVNTNVTVTAQLTTAEGIDLAYGGVKLTLVVTDPSGAIVDVKTGVTDKNGTCTWTFMGTKPGTYTFTVSNATFGITGTNTTTFVGNATELVVSVNKTTIYVNDTVSINATVYDVNGYVTSALDGKAVTFLVNNMVIGMANFSNGVATITYKFAEPGTYTIVAFYNATLQDSITITVSEMAVEPWMLYDMDHDGKISKDELIDAFDDWMSGKITINDFINIFDKWMTS